jgi:hypothetical protein
MWLSRASDKREFPPTKERGRPVTELHVHFHFPPELTAYFVRRQDDIPSILRHVEAVMATLADVKAKVDAQGTVIESAVTLINGISQQLKDALANNDPTAVQAVIDELDAQDQSLAAAVAANTPATLTPADTTGGAAAAP